MRIFQVLSNTTNSNLPHNNTWYRNLYEPLIEMGHDVFLYDSYQGKKAMFTNNIGLRTEFSEKLLKEFRREHMKNPFDMFFSYFMNGMVDEDIVKTISDMDVPTCNFSCNNTHQFHLVDKISKCFDFNLHSEKDSKSKFDNIGATEIWWPMASNPKYFKPQNITKNTQASFVGANYALRSKNIEYLLENKIDVHAYGPGWDKVARTNLRAHVKRGMLLMKTLGFPPIRDQYRNSSILAELDCQRYMIDTFPNNLHPPVSDDKLISLYSESYISLGFLDVYDKHDPSSLITHHLHLREFEAPMCGALYITGYMDELSEMFEPEKEVVTYRNQYELLDKVKFYLKHDNIANKIRKAARKRALKEHTYHHRYIKLFKQIGL
jgi:spore maturation protein CgeB